MTLYHNDRRAALDYLNGGKLQVPETSPDNFFENYCSAIQRGKLIPIVGDTIRTAHIFDIDFDEDIGMKSAQERAQAAAGIEDNCSDKQEAFGFAREKLNVIEELAYRWASEDVNYPLTDGFQIARVAQYHSLAKDDYSLGAKGDYLDFLKRTLIREAYQIELASEDKEEIAFLQELFMERSQTFSQIVSELDFPRFKQGKEDPLRILARLPLKIYLTTSYHDFLERELEAADKRPRSRLCFWNIRPDDVDPQFRPMPDDKPNVEEPIVYHLLGMEKYPESIVLSEDDYLNLLWELARDAPGSRHKGAGIIPPYLEAELREASLLLLGYRLQDWDLRVLFWGLLRSRQKVPRPKWPSTAIQLNLADQPLIHNEDQAKEYLKRYFKQIKLDVRFGDSDDFIYELGREYQQYSQGKSST